MFWWRRGIEHVNDASLDLEMLDVLAALVFEMPLSQTSFVRLTSTTNSAKTSDRRDSSAFIIS